MKNMIKRRVNPLDPNEPQAEWCMVPAVGRPWGHSDKEELGPATERSLGLGAEGEETQSNKRPVAWTTLVVYTQSRSMGIRA